MQIKINNLTDLQDARYCAAVGFSCISFNLQKNSPYFQTPDQIRQMSAWLTGIQIAIETDAESNDLLAEIYPTFPFDYWMIKEEDWGKLAFMPPYPVMLKSDVSNENAALKLPENAMIELEVVDFEEIEKHTMAKNCIWVVRDIHALLAYLEANPNCPCYFSLYEAALHEEGGLDYELLDKLASYLPQNQEA